jgi:hypothetical protein
MAHGGVCAGRLPHDAAAYAQCRNPVGHRYASRRSHNRTESFIPGQQSTVAPLAPKGLLFPGDTGVGRGIISTKYFHVSPRVGFALDPFGTARPPSAGPSASSSARSPAMSGTSPATPFRSRCGHRPARVRSAPSPITTRHRETSPRRRRVAACFPTSIAEQARIHLRARRRHRSHLPEVQVSLHLPDEPLRAAAVTRPHGPDTAYVGALSHQLPNFIDANYSPYSTAFGTPSTSAQSVADRRQFDPCVGACPTGAAAINNGTGVLGASMSTSCQTLRPVITRCRFRRPSSSPTASA